MAAEPSAGASALQLRAMESIVTSALLPHRSDSRTVLAACNALTWLLRGGGSDAAARAAKLGVPKVLSDVTFGRLSSEPLIAVRAARLSLPYSSSANASRPRPPDLSVCLLSTQGAVADLFAALLHAADAHAADNPPTGPAVAGSRGRGKDAPAAKTKAPPDETYNLPKQLEQTLIKEAGLLKLVSAGNANPLRVELAQARRFPAAV